MSNFEIKIPHFYCLEYYEESRKMKFEIDFRESVINLNTSMVKEWEHPYEAEIISETKKREIIINIYNYLRVYNSPNRIKMEGI